MDTVKQVYLLDEKGNKYSPIVAPQSVYVDDDVTLNNHLDSSDKLVFYSLFEKRHDGGGYLRLDNQIPTSNISRNDTSYFTISDSRAVCQKAGRYRIEATVRARDLDTTGLTNPQDVNQNSDFGIRINVNNSIKTEYWMESTFRVCLEIESICQLSVGQTVGLTVVISKPSTNEGADFYDINDVTFKIYAV